MTPPTTRLAVILPVHNGEKYVTEAIESVLIQTFTNFELLVIDDGSTDRTAELLSNFTDARLRMLRFSDHRGLVFALNAGISEARSEFIARMDADDICMPKRFERQVRFLEKHPEVAICGSWMRVFGTRQYLSCPPTEPEQLHTGLFFGWVLSHPTMMIRRSFLERTGLVYTEEFCHAEDLDFLMRASETARMANVPEFLVHYRQHDDQVSVIHRQRQLEATERLMVRQLRLLLPDVGDEEAAFHVDLANAVLPPSRLREAGDWLLRLDSVNSQQGKYSTEYFRRGLSQWWFSAHKMQAASGGLGVLKSYWSSPFARMGAIDLRSHVAMIAKCIFGRLAVLLRGSKGVK